MHLKKINPLWIIFLLGLLIRLSLLFIDFSFDVNNHIVWAQDAWNRGLSGFYETKSSQTFGTSYPNYPPFSIGLFIASLALYKGIFQLAWFLNVTIPQFPSFIIPILEDRFILAGFMKLPAIGADLGLALVLAQIAESVFPKRKNIPLIVSSLILFHPTFFYNSAFWGQIDSIPLFFTALGFLLLSFKKRPYMGMFSMIMAILIKPTALLFVPPFLLVLFLMYDFRKTVKVIGSGILLYWLSFLPMIRGDNTLFYPFVIYKEGILDTQSIGAVSNAAYSAWVLNPALFYIPAETFAFGTITYQTLGNGIAAISALFILYFLWKSRLQKVTLFFALGMIAFSSFLFFTKMHERYMILILPFLLIPALQSRNIFYCWIVISVISFLNLYKSWSLPRIEFLAKALSWDPVVIILVAINIVVFIFLLKQYIAFTDNKKRA